MEHRGSRGTMPVMTPAAVRPATTSSYQVDVFTVRGQRGAKPVKLASFQVRALTRHLARREAHAEVTRRQPGCRVRALTSNRRSGGFVAYVEG